MKTQLERIADVMKQTGHMSAHRIIENIREIINGEITDTEHVNDLAGNERRVLVNENLKDEMPMSSTGARRSKLMATDFRFDLLDSNDAAMRRLAKVFALGFKKYGPDNWKKGFPNSEYYAHHREHMLAYSSGKKTDEDDLAHAAWNLLAMMWNEENLPEMCDFPVQQKS